MRKKCSIPLWRVSDFTDFDSLQYKAPFKSQLNRCYHGDFVTDDSGSGLVHLSPAHGKEDYLLGLQHCLDVVSHGKYLLMVVDENGKLDGDVPSELHGIDVTSKDVQLIIDYLKERDWIIGEEKITHRYPYDWRSKKPLIQRATKQWFINLTGIKKNLASCLEGIKTYPAHSVSHLEEMVMKREEWCISRQRSWGVPIPVFKTKQGDALLCPDNIEYVADIFGKEGSDAWWMREVKDLLHPKYKHLHESLEKGSDTMDGWLDSGVTWNILGDEKADLYIEGMDQFRGWFQSSLIMSVAARNISPFKAIAAHGFVVDENGKKMSKSLGNVMEPKKVIDAKEKGGLGFGADTLRLWACSIDYSSASVCIGNGILCNNPCNLKCKY